MNGHCCVRSAVVLFFIWGHLGVPTFSKRGILRRRRAQSNVKGTPQFLLYVCPKNAFLFNCPFTKATRQGRKRVHYLHVLVCIYIHVGPQECFYVHSTLYCANL
ncbi:hypothetical protein POVWA1_038040 [Plasmodium ovale wallikeri]|uniref:Uncharacterized protein n=1 Tax=Plasmodium ovale wallikeri TaxID=864142 RepID=A0A1A8Z3N7_PLAOA|nr:hypothetical protein POVWA1_038040 [Plasmodium ovale wallikeri]